jgi:hypothetical protein
MARIQAQPFGLYNSDYTSTPPTASVAVRFTHPNIVGYGEVNVIYSISLLSATTLTNLKSAVVDAINADRSESNTGADVQLMTSVV